MGGRGAAGDAESAGGLEESWLRQTDPCHCRHCRCCCCSVLMFPCLGFRAVWGWRWTDAKGREEEAGRAVFAVVAGVGSEGGVGTGHGGLDAWVRQGRAGG